MKVQNFVLTSAKQGQNVASVCSIMVTIVICGRIVVFMEEKYLSLKL